MVKRIEAMILAISLIVSTLAGLQICTIESDAAYTVTESDLFYKCPEYLNNAPYSQYFSKCEERIAAGMGTVSEGEKVAASILYSLQNGKDIITSELASLAGLSSSTYKKLNKKVMCQIVQTYLASDTTATDTAAQIGNGYSTISDAYKIANKVDIANYKADLSSASRNLSKDQIDKLVDMYTSEDSFGKILKYAGTAQKALKVITAYIEMQDLDLSVLRELDEMYSSYDSDFSQAINEIMTDRTSDIVTFAKNNYLKDAIIEKAVGIITKNLSSPVLFVKEISAKIIGKIYEQYFPTADEIIQAGMCQAYTYLARNRMNYYKKEFQKGRATEEKISQYKTAFSFYLSTMKMTMNKVSACVNGSDKWMKNSLKDWSSALGTSLTYTDYISRCTANATSDVSKGLLTISGNSVVRKTSDGTVIDSNYNSTESITARLTEIKRQYPPNVGRSWYGEWGGCKQCYGFARMVFSKLYGCEMPARYDASAMYRYRSEENVDLIGQIVGSNVNSTSVANLFSQAKIGDVIQASGSTYGQHTMIFMGLTDSGIEVYDCNAAVNGASSGQCVINQWKISYASLASWYGGASNAGISVYRASNYASIYGNGEDMFYDDSVNFVIEDGVLIKYNGWQSFVEIPDTVTAIGNGAFKNNKTMMGVTIPDSVTSIGKEAFYNCTSLLGVIIPDSVESIGSSAFALCSKLAHVKLPEGKYTTINSKIFYKCSSLSEIEIPSYVVTIEEYAFNSCINLQNASLHNNISYLGESAFGSCENLNNIYISKKISCDGGLYDSNGPFDECISLRNIEFQKGITEIPSSIFAGCTGINEIDIPDTVTQINQYAFQGCVNLKKVSWSEALTSIGQRAFKNCASLANVNLKKVEYVGGYAFSNCESLEEVYIPKTISRTGYSYWDMADGACFAYCPNLSKIVFDKEIKHIPADFFRKIAVEKIELPEELITIGTSAFSGASNLKTIVWNDKIETICNYAFSSCTSLQEVKIPDTVLYMGKNANGYGEYGYVFMNCTELNKVSLPESLSDIGEKTFYNCSKLEEINIPKSIKTICSSAFEKCSSLKDINLPENLEYIYGSAFSKCISLEKITIPNSVQSMSGYIFQGCENLVDVNIGTGVKKIEDSSFQDCASLEKIDLPYGIETLGKNVFKNCVSFTKITIPKATTSISDTAFSYPDKLTIYGVTGSYAETFANENDIAFVGQTVPTENLSITPQETTVEKGKELQLSLAITPFTSTDDVVWKSVDESIATVDASGKVRGVSGGETEIQVSAGTKTATCKISVISPATSIYLNRSEIELDANNPTYQLTSRVYPSDTTDNVVWSVSDSTVATVDTTGKVVAVGVGEATVTATVGSETATCLVKVKGTNNEIPPLDESGGQMGDNSSTNNNIGGDSKNNIVNDSVSNQQGGSLLTTTDNIPQISTMESYKAVIKSLTNTLGKKLKLTIKKAKNIKGYQVQYATDKKFKKKKALTTKKTSITIKKLSKKKTYYVRVRAYVLNGKKKVYGKWSKVKKVKIKK